MHSAPCGWAVCCVVGVRWALAKGDWAWMPVGMWALIVGGPVLALGSATGSMRGSGRRATWRRWCGVAVSQLALCAVAAWASWHALDWRISSP